MCLLHMPRKKLQLCALESRWGTGRGNVRCTWLPSSPGTGANHTRWVDVPAAVTNQDRSLQLQTPAQ